MTLLPIIIVLVSAFIHAGWNLAAHSQRTDRIFFLRVGIVIGVVVLGPALVVEFLDPVFSLQVWGLLALTGFFQATYMLGLMMGYRNGDFSVVYPVVRGLPVLLLALVDTARGRPISALGWLGIFLVFSGCVLAPLESLRGARLKHYWNRTSLWIVVTALSTVGYSTVDKIAAEMMPPGPIMAARYGAFEHALSVPYLWLMLVMAREPISRDLVQANWKLPAVAALFVFGGYWLILWAYQLSPYASYIVTLRQFSIVIGVVVATLIFREPARRLRLTAAFLITAGVMSIALAG